MISSMVDIRTSCFAARLAAFSCPQKHWKELIFRGALKANGNRFYIESLDDIQNALSDLYGGQDVSLQQLAATFRRGDLIERLSRMRVS